jgi:K+-sensing histidine kinase KdpD
VAVRGRLRVLLGAAPGVGKTYAMLDEGKQASTPSRSISGSSMPRHST